MLKKICYRVFKKNQNLFLNLSYSDQQVETHNKKRGK